MAAAAYAAATAGFKRKAVQPPLDARAIAATSMLMYSERRTATRARMAEMLSCGPTTEMAVSTATRGSLRTYHDDAVALFRLTTARVMQAMTHRTVKDAEEAREALTLATIELHAAIRVTMQWSDAAHRACVVMDRALPRACVDIVRSFLH